jgi:murein DD-endopeptidase MepM/ murein hydrolase activator NlpD
MSRANPTRAARTGGIEIGNEPPLDPSGDAVEVDRKGVSLRWLGANVLIAFTGAALIGGAIYVSLQGEATFAEWPEKVAAARVAPTDDRTTAARKGDKLVRSEVVALAKHAFRAPMSQRAGDREIIRVRNFVRIATNLSLTSGVYASDIPPFNPLRLFNENAAERQAEVAAEAPDADVSLVKYGLADLAIEPNAPALGDDDAVAQIEEERRLLADAGRRPSLAIPAQMMLTRTLRQPEIGTDALGYAPRALEAAFTSIEVRVVPENVTTLAKQERSDGVEERDATLKRGETLDAALGAQGATPDQVRGIVAGLGGRTRTATLAEGQRLRILVGPGSQPGDPRQVIRVVLYGERGIEGITAVNDRGQYVPVAVPVEGPQRAGQEEDEDEEEGTGGVRLYESLYETALKNDLSAQTVEDLIRIFGYDVDFQRRVSPGDSFELFFSEDEGTERPDILFAALTVAGETRRVYRFQGEDGTIDFFDEAGRSLKKFLLRKPVAAGDLRSGFGMRRHPILGYSKMHTGVDWSNPIGTPIMAAGNGTILKSEWDSGYGRRIELQHANGYVTAYSHLSRFGRGVQPGARVRQGQVIGYVGNTGLSTGPHLHYEVIVNGRFVDPMRIRVPRGRELDGRALAEFKRQREQVDELLQKAGGTTRLAESR